MAFTATSFYNDRGTYNSQTTDNMPALHKYGSATDTLSEITASGYFDEAAIGEDSPGAVTPIIVSDIISIKGTDESGLFKVTGVSPVTIDGVESDSNFNIFSSTAEIVAGGSTSAVIAIPGVLSTDLVYVTFANLTNNAYIVNTTAAADQVTLGFNVDPGPSQVNIQVVRATTA